MRCPSKVALLFLCPWLMLGAGDATAVYRFREFGSEVCGPVGHSRTGANDVLCAIFCSKDESCCAFSTSKNLKASCLLHTEIQREPSEDYICYIRDSAILHTSLNLFIKFSPLDDHHTLSSLPPETSPNGQSSTSAPSSPPEASGSHETSTTTEISLMSTVSSGAAAVTAVTSISASVNIFETLTESTTAPNTISNTTTPTINISQPNSTLTTDTPPSFLFGSVTVKESDNRWFECPTPYVIYGLTYNSSANAATEIFCGLTKVDPIEWTAEFAYNECPFHKLPNRVSVSNYYSGLLCTEMTPFLVFDVNACVTKVVDAGPMSSTVICDDYKVLKSVNISSNQNSYNHQMFSSTEQITFTCCSLKVPLPLPSLSITALTTPDPSCIHQGSTAMVAIGLDYSSEDVKYLVCSTFDGSLVTDSSGVNEIKIVTQGDSPDSCSSDRVMVGLRSIAYNKENKALCANVADYLTIDTGNCITVLKNVGPRPSIPGVNTNDWKYWISCLHLVGNYTIQMIVRKCIDDSHSRDYCIQEFSSIQCCPVILK
ncbi:location of vulva defective 1-like [Palaemon carinicauda]|uniref:location of vulva defective 1-like n=1 Tax=Palaemon carinicauda TaxID=392227 RepID=UPI0035B643DB